MNSANQAPREIAWKIHKGSSPSNNNFNHWKRLANGISFPSHAVFASYFWLLASGLASSFLRKPEVFESWYWWSTIAEAALWDAAIYKDHAPIVWPGPLRAYTAAAAVAAGWLAPACDSLPLAAAALGAFVLLRHVDPVEREFNASGPQAARRIKPNSFPKKED